MGGYFRGASNKFAVRLGYVASYLLFTFVLYCVLSFLDKMPTSWSFVHIMGVTVIVAFSGSVLKRLLK
ncbi:MAG: hypothetical protein KAJ54_03495 [Candidatus Aenigmarchaeota archaeon]|nr:hypothetical protein [Candidatus Aenigmarchaeota archaeon]